MIWDTSNWSRAALLDDRGIQVRSIQFSPDGSRIAVSSKNSVVTYDAFPGYVREKSRQLLPALDARIRANTASQADYLLRGEVFAAQGEWDRAAAVYAKYYEADNTDPWILSDVWIAGGFPGQLDTRHETEIEYAAGNIDVPAPLQTASGEVTWRRFEMEPKQPLNFNRLLGSSGPILSTNKRTPMLGMDARQTAP